MWLYCLKKQVTRVNTKDKKMIVLHQLSLESAPIGLSELLFFTGYPAASSRGI